jgi:hypothetical protein
MRVACALAAIWIAGLAAACSLSLDDLTSGNGSSDAGGLPSILDGDDATDGAMNTMPGGGDASGAAGDDSGAVATGGDASDPPPVDSGSTGHGIDSGNAVDAAKDPAKDAAPSSYCASLSPAPLFCDDFDEVGDLAVPPWDQVTGANGTATIVSSVDVSAPSSLLVQVNPNASASAVDVAGYKSFTAKQGATGVCTFAFDFRVDIADMSSGSDAVLAAIQLWNGSALWDLELELSYASATSNLAVSFTENAPYVSHPVSQNLSLGEWTRVSMTIALPAGSGGATPATLSFNGAQVASATVHVTTNNPIPEILVGATVASSSSSGWLAHYDNVTFNQP